MAIALKYELDQVRRVVCLAREVRPLHSHGGKNMWPGFSCLSVFWLRWIARGCMLGLWFTMAESINLISRDFIPFRDTAVAIAAYLSLPPLSTTFLASAIGAGIIGAAIHGMLIIFASNKWEWESISAVALVPSELLSAMMIDVSAFVLTFVAWLILIIPAAIVEFFSPGAGNALLGIVFWIAVVISAGGFVAYALLPFLTMDSVDQEGSRKERRKFSLLVEYISAGLMLLPVMKIILPFMDVPFGKLILAGVCGASIFIIYPAAVLSGTRGASVETITVSVKQVCAHMIEIAVSSRMGGAPAFVLNFGFTLFIGILFAVGAFQFFAEKWGPSIDMSLNLTLAVVASSYVIAAFLNVANYTASKLEHTHGTISVFIPAAIVFVIAVISFGGSWLHFGVTLSGEVQVSEIDKSTQMPDTSGAPKTSPSTSATTTRDDYLVFDGWVPDAYRAVSARICTAIRKQDRGTLDEYTRDGSRAEAESTASTIEFWQNVGQLERMRFRVSYNKSSDMSITIADAETGMHTCHVKWKNPHYKLYGCTFNDGH